MSGRDLKAPAKGMLSSCALRIKAKYRKKEPVETAAQTQVWN